MNPRTERHDRRLARACGSLSRAQRRLRPSGASVSLALATTMIAAPSAAAPGAGTLDDPLVVDALPYAVALTTVGATSDVIDSYSCAAATDESGPEVVFRFELGAPAKVSAWVEGDGGGVDIDVHLLDDDTIDGAVAASCAARGNEIAEAQMDAGTHWVVVDSFDGEAQAGPFVLHLDAIGDEWVERVLAEGVSWRARRFVDMYGPQVVHAVVIDPSATDVVIRAVAASGCQTVGSIGAAEGAVAGINGGYFDTGGGCPPVSLLIEDDVLVHTNGSTRGAFGVLPDGSGAVQVVAAGQDWPEVVQAHGGGPVLVVDSVPYNGAADWADQGFTSSSFNGDNPRTFAGFDAGGSIHFATVDGRRSNASGMSLDELAAFAAGEEMGLAEVVNLDGGGSTTMWIAGATPNGVVNYPSDATQETATHPGSRGCSGGFFVFAPEYNHPPRFQTDPVATATAGETYSYDADALDLDVHDVVSFSLTDGPPGMVVDPASGVVTYGATSESPPSVEVVLRASDDRGASTDQSWTLLVEGGMGAQGAGGGSGGGGTGGESAGGDGGEAPPGPGLPFAEEDSGCSCSTPGGGRAVPPGTWLVLVAGGAALVRRRRAAAPGASPNATRRSGSPCRRVPR